MLAHLKFTRHISILLLLVFIPNLALASQNQSGESYHFHFNNIPSHTFGDLKQSFWGAQGLVFAATTLASLAFLPADKSINNQLKKNPAFSHGFDQKIGLVISPYTLGGATLLTFLISTKSHNEKFVVASESATEAFVGAMAITGGLKYAIQRKRPNGKNYSMPSAHAAAAFSLASTAADFYGLKVGIPSFALASLVSFTRVDGGYHSLTDVLIGAAIGTTLGVGSAEFHQKQHSDFFITPQISKNENGLLITRTF